MNGLNVANLRTYSADQVASLADGDHHSVRDAGLRRRIALKKKRVKGKDG